MTPTKLVYLDDMGLLQLSAKVMAIQQEDGKLFVVLDQTIFYPQGGGQPFDMGAIKSPTAEFHVDEIRFVMYGAVGIPCGGTHVGALSDIEHITIRKIKNEKGNIRVSYEV
jgi:alanyl-tRNA synthetase